MQLYFDDENKPEAKTVKTLTKAASLICEEEGFDPSVCSFSVTFTDEKSIRELNKTYRGVDSATDVLSFPQFEAGEEIEECEEILLGDVVICTQRAMAQAEEYGHSLEREITYLFVHSLFHLFGYDHMEDCDKAIMRAKEEKIMNELGITR